MTARRVPPATAPGNDPMTDDRNAANRASHD